MVAGLAAPKALGAAWPNNEVFGAACVDPNMFDDCCGCEKAKMQ